MIRKSIGWRFVASLVGPINRALIGHFVGVFVGCFVGTCIHWTFHCMSDGTIRGCLVCRIEGSLV